MPQAKIIRDFPFDIDERSVLRHQGYRPSSPVSERVRALLDDALSKAKELARPQGLWKIFKIEELESEVVRVAGFEIRSKQVAKLMRGCVEAALLAATVGPELEAESARLMKDGELAEGVMLDSAASEAAEGCAEAVNLLIQKEVHRRGLHLTPRYSPGYGDWTVEHQRELFAALEPEKIGIKLTESCMMIPRKSVSAILGLGPIDKIRTGASPCKKCSKSNLE